MQTAAIASRVNPADEDAKAVEDDLLTLARSAKLQAMVPRALMFWAGLVIVMVGLLQYSVFGRRTHAIGNNRQATCLSGAPVRWTLVCVYAFSGLTAGLAGILLAGYSNNAYLGMGDAYVLWSIAAVVIGGTSILGDPAAMGERSPGR